MRSFERFPPYGEIVCTHSCVLFPFRLERLNNLLFCPLSVRFYSNLSSYSIVKDLVPFPCRILSDGSSGLAGRTAAWSVWMDSNHRPRAYQARALAT